MAGVLSCGPYAALSHTSAAALWGIAGECGTRIEVSVLAPSARRRPGLLVHRRSGLEPGDITTHRHIPCTCPVRTLVDLAIRLGSAQLEAAINEADKRDLIDPEALRSRLDELGGAAGVARLRGVLDRRTFTVTDSELERRLLAIALSAGLSVPRAGEHLNGFKVDFHWPDLGLVVETDGLRYHRTPAQQARDRLRDQTHTAAGLTTLRFTHGQVRYEPDRVERTLAAVARRLTSRA